MNTYTAVLAAVVAPFALIAAGMLFRRWQLLRSESESSLLALVVNIFVPCLMLSLIVGNPTVLTPAQVGITPFIGFGLVAAGMLVGLAVSPLLGLNVGNGRRSFILSVSIFNYGFIPIPIISLLFGSETLATLFVFNLGVDIALWSLGMALLSGSWSKETTRRVFNPITITVLVALAVNFTGLHTYVPNAVMRLFDLTGGAAIPVAIMLNGAILYEVLRSGGFRDGLPVTLTGTLLRSLILPALFVALAFAFDFGVHLERVLLVQAAMPAGMTTIALSRLFGGHPNLVVRIVVLTTGVSLITIPLWIWAGSILLGLEI